MSTKYPEMNWEVPDLPEEFKLFKQRMELVLADQEITETKKKAIKIKIAVGNEGLRRINASGLSEADQEKPQELWKLFEKQIKVNINFRVHRLELMRYRQRQDESIDAFVTRCRDKANTCDFEESELAERIMEVVITSTPSLEFQKFLLDQPKGYQIDAILVEGRKYEAVAASRKCLETLEPAKESIDSFKRNQGRKTCGNCGRIHKPRQCPAYHDVCRACDTKGHWAKFCRKAKNDRSRKPDRRSDDHKSDDRQPKHGNQSRSKSKGRKYKPISEMDTEHDTSTDHEHQQSAGPSNFEHFDTIHTIGTHTVINSKGTVAFANIDIICPQKSGQHYLYLKIDSGASANTITVRTAKQIYGDKWRQVVKRTPVKLVAYGEISIPCVGTLDIKCRYKSPEWYTHTFYVADVNGPAILGLLGCTDLGIITIHTMHKDTPTHTPITSVSDLKQTYPDQFDAIGSFSGKAMLHLKDDAEPTIDAPRKCSVHLKDKIKAELDNMEKQGVIRKIEHHTDWCSSMTTVVKKDGSIRICLDPRRLNDALKRCPHKIPTLEEVQPIFAGAQFFSKLDAKAGYWSVHLAEECQDLTTFRTPFGRYCFQRLPFGLCTSQDIFQQHMDRIVQNVPGCVCIADDIAIVGKTEEEHDKNLHLLMETAKQEGLVFNSSKCTIKKEAISYFGSMYTRSGIFPDPSKVEAINTMPSPKDKEDVQRCLGLFTYLAPYIPNLSEKSAPLRELLHKEIPFVWDEDHEHALNSLKSAVSSGACLQFFDPKKETTVEVDASMKGLGACLLQDGKPVAFASKSLSNAQSNYSNIERETLALVFGIVRFHTYLFGKEFTVITDHRPLETIWKKPLRSAPPRLQRLLIKVQGYRCQVKYRPGKEMILSDTLSRLPNPKEARDVPLDIRVESICSEVEDTHQIDLIFFGQHKRTELQRETSNDPVLRSLWQTVTQGWPETLQELPTSLREFWSYRDEIGVSQGVLFKGSRVIIPKTLREDILRQLHLGHMGIESTRRLARETVFWPHINKDIEQIVKQCAACQEHQARQQKEPLLPHDVPSAPWTRLGTDLFMLNRQDYLLVTDYYSKYPIVYKLTDTSSAAVANVMSGIFSLFGPPEEIVSDNGPQFVGKHFKDMCRKWSITHTTSSPHYPRSNGLAERMVRTVKNLLKKCSQTGQDSQLAMSHLRATPVDSHMRSPAEMLFGRPIRTTLPSHNLSRESTTTDHLLNRQSKMKETHDRHAGPDLPPLHVGQPVRVLHPKDHTWIPAKVSKVCDEPRSYEVSTPNGGILRRNRSHLREIPSSTNPTPKRVRFDEDYTSSTQAETPQQNGNNHQPTPETQNIQSKGPTSNSQTTTRYGRNIRTPARYMFED
ncbi:uncharacterized protein LOC115920236 [Strongylocentrotus purpuratus]|uniref:Endonuclease n=1 Tax=Strongylocentrotus purpuratus TaxID=7668 RepID=A0A7M7N708_STRPU|nr:uncharacterized protein LOC115920236 [Strongylocentrotus purpuratus]